MTAHYTTSAASDNSVFQVTEDKGDTPANERAHVQITDHATENTSCENAVNPSIVTEEQRSRVIVTLVQNHLATLDELNAGRDDSRSKPVEPTDGAAALAELIWEITTDCYTSAEEGGE